jgi:hypothetical protein
MRKKKPQEGEPRRKYMRKVSGKYFKIKCQKAKKIESFLFLALKIPKATKHKEYP